MPGKRPSPLRGRYPFYLPQGWRDSPQGTSLFIKYITLLEIWNPPPVCTQKSGSPLGKPLFDRTCFAPAYGRFFMLEPFHAFCAQAVLRCSGGTGAQSRLSSWPSRCWESHGAAVVPWQGLLSRCESFGRTWKTLSGRGNFLWESGIV